MLTFSPGFRSAGFKRLVKPLSPEDTREATTRVTLDETSFNTAVDARIFAAR